MRTIPPEVEYLNERVLATFRDHAEDVFAILGEAVQMNREPAPPLAVGGGEAHREN